LAATAEALTTPYRAPISIPMPTIRSTAAATPLLPT